MSNVYLPYLCRISNLDFRTSINQQLAHSTNTFLPEAPKRGLPGIRSLAKALNGRARSLKNPLSPVLWYLPTPMLIADCGTLSNRLPLIESHHLKITE